MGERKKTLRVYTIGPSELFLGQIFDFFSWKQAILEIGLTLFLGSDSCSPDSHTKTHANHSYLVRDSVACANQNCVPANTATIRLNYIISAKAIL
jgi:hypothetical protein